MATALREKKKKFWKWIVMTVYNIVNILNNIELCA